MIRISKRTCMYVCIVIFVEEAEKDEDICMGS